MNLNELMNEYARVSQALLESGGELLPEMESSFNKVIQNMPRKVDAYAFTIDKLEDDAKHLAEKAKLFLNAAKALDKARESIRERLKHIMIEHGLLELNGENEKFILCATQDSFKIDETLLPSGYKKTIVTVSPDKERIKADMKIGTIIPGVERLPSFALRKGIVK